MKTSNKYIVLAAMALTFAACTQEEDFTPQTDGDAVKINATIGRLQTRVAYEDNGVTNFINRDQICVENIKRTNKNIATYTFDGSTWTTTDALVWNGGTAESQFQAWYPATASFDEFTLPTDQNTIEKLSTADWMTASTDEIAKPADGVLHLAFQHRLAKVTVQIMEFATQFDEDPHLKAATIYSLNNDYVTVNGGIKPVLGGNAATAIVCPGTYAAGTNLMEIIVSDDRGETNLDVPVNAFLTNTGLEAGKHYKFSLKVGKDAISITKVNVEPWTTKEIDGGVATEALSINATAITPDKLNATVTNALVLGYTDITVTLKPDAPAEMITAIRRAICDTDGVDNGSIHLTLKGVTTIPGSTNRDGVAFGLGYIYDEAGEFVAHEKVTQLASINLPDVTEIGAQAFDYCENLVTVSAPKAQTIGAEALSNTALTSVEFPELTTIPTSMFAGASTLSSAKFPKVTTIEHMGLLVGGAFRPERNPTPFPLELTAEGDITFNGKNHFNVESQNYSGKVDLVLNIDKKDQVTFHDDGTATWQVRDDLSYTFKSITFVGD